MGNLLILGVLSVTLFGKTPTMKQYGNQLMGETIEVWKAGKEIVLWIH